MQGELVGAVASLYGRTGFRGEPSQFPIYQVVPKSKHRVAFAERKEAALSPPVQARNYSLPRWKIAMHSVEDVASATDSLMGTGVGCNPMGLQPVNGSRGVLVVVYIQTVKAIAHEKAKPIRIAPIVLGISRCILPIRN